MEYSQNKAQRLLPPPPPPPTKIHTFRATCSLMQPPHLTTTFGPDPQVVILESLLYMALGAEKEVRPASLLVCEG